MKFIVIHTEARKELDVAIAYYEAQQLGLGLDFLTTVESALKTIQQNPIWEQSTKWRGYVVTLLNVFPI